MVEHDAAEKTKITIELSPEEFAKLDAAGALEIRTVDEQATALVLTGLKLYPRKAPVSVTTERSSSRPKSPPKPPVSLSTPGGSIGAGDR